MWVGGLLIVGACVAVVYLLFLAPRADRLHGAELTTTLAASAVSYLAGVVLYTAGLERFRTVETARRFPLVLIGGALVVGAVLAVAVVGNALGSLTHGGSTGGPAQEEGGSGRTRPSPQPNLACALIDERLASSLLGTAVRTVPLATQLYRGARSRCAGRPRHRARSQGNATRGLRHAARYALAPRATQNQRPR
jgi:hypothetical protein